MLFASLTASFLLILLLGAFLVVAVLIVRLTQRKRGAASSAGVSGLYSARHAILSPAERSFAGVLDGALPDGVTWFAKVRLGDIVVTKKGLTASQRATAWNRVNQKHVDFLLVRTSDFAPLAGLELDDRSHEEESRQARDSFVDEVFRTCELPLLHIPAQAAYNQTELRITLSTALSKSP